jgi:hypothetical protein
MEFDTTKTAIAFVAIIAIATAAMTLTPMGTNTVLMMVLPSMVIGGLVFLALGVKYGEYRASR